MYDVDELGLLTREVLREQTAALVAEACAWSVGLSDRQHHARRHGRVVPSGVTLGQRAEADLPLAEEQDAPLELAEARPGTFADALGALNAEGRLEAQRFEDEVLVPFVLQTCVRAAERARVDAPTSWGELLDELGEDGTDLEEVVRAAEWEAPLRTLAEQLVLAALGDVPLVAVEHEGLPLSLVRAAEAATRAAASPLRASALGDEELAGALFLAEAALGAAELALPVSPAEAGALLAALTGEGLEPDEVLGVLPHLPVLADTADLVAQALRRSA